MRPPAEGPGRTPLPIPDMFRVLLIPLAQSELPPWSLEGFQVECALDEEDGIQRLKAQLRDAVVVVTRGDSTGATELCARLEAACGPDVVPLMLAADGRDLTASEPLELLPLDAFVDLAWDPRLIQRCLSAAIHRVRAGRGVAELQRQVLRAVREEVAELKDQSVRDALTGLYNLRYFREVMAREHARCQRHGRSYAVVFFDLDNLRELNNLHGHAVGTRALARVGVALETTTRKADYAFRVGGDEFVSLLVESDRASAIQYAERICGTLRQCALLAGDARAELSISAGVAVFPEDGATEEAVLKAADAAMYRAKALGRNRIATSGDAG